MLSVTSQPRTGVRSAPHMPPSPAAIDPLELASHRPQLVKFAMRELRNASQAEDVVQETLLAALQGAGRFRGGASLGTWLTGILKHKIVDHYRRGRREISLADGGDGPALDELDALAAEHDDLPGPAAPSDWGDPESAFQQERFFEVLERGMSRLSGNAARVFRMREVLGMSTDEICKALGITPTHCAVLLYRARMALRDHLQKEWFADGPAKT